MTKTFLQQLTESLEKKGFFNKKHSWYKDSKDLIQVIDLQKSEYSNLYYVNFGIYVKALGCANDKTETCLKTPSEPHCHLRLRAESFLSPQDMQTLNQAVEHEDIDTTMKFLDILYDLHFKNVDTLEDLKNKIHSDIKYQNRSDRRLKEMFSLV